MLGVKGTMYVYGLFPHGFQKILGFLKTPQKFDTLEMILDLHTVWMKVMKPRQEQPKH